MRIIAFAGPSRPVFLDPAVDWRPPAAAGDLLAVMAERPDCVVLIDGYFDARPAPWHKEILLLMEAGIAVIGAASMGALRAAELSPFGMIGVGMVYTAYRSGRLVADDEVAVLHAPERLGWRPLTEALVNIRATLCAAVRARAIDPSGARCLLIAAQRLNFRDRTWPLLLERAAAEAPERSFQHFIAWLDQARIDIKRADAARAIELSRVAHRQPALSYQTPRTSLLKRLAESVGVTLPPTTLPAADPCLGWSV